MRSLIAACVLFFFLIGWTSCRKERVTLQWTEQDSGSSYTLEAIHFYDPERGVAVGGDTWLYGQQLYTVDGGRTWTTDSLSSKKMYCLTASAAGGTFAAGVDGIILHTADTPPQGPWNLLRYQVWKPYRGMDRNQAGTLLLVGGGAYRNGILVRVRSNFSMDQIDTLDYELADVAWLNEEEAVAVGYGIVVRTEDGGNSWSPLDVDGDFFRAVAFPTPGVGYAVGFSGTIIKTEDGGRTWTKQRAGGTIWQSDIRFRDIAFVDEERGYIVGEQGCLWRTRNGGADWEVVRDLPAIDFHGLSVVETNNGFIHGWACGEEGRILYFEDP